MVLFIMWWLSVCSVTIQMKATMEYFPVLLFVMLYKMALTFESMDKIRTFDHSSENY